MKTAQASASWCTAIVLASLCALSAPGFAQGTGTAPTTEPPHTVKLTPDALEVQAPQGWEKGKRPKGTLVMLRPMDGSKSQLEIKAAAGMTERQATVFFKTFSVSLERSGIKRKTSKKLTLGEKQGRLTTYELTASEQRYVLLVFEHHQDDVAWLFVGFFDGLMLSKQQPAFETLVRDTKFKPRP